MYKLLGADQKEYGPVSAEQVRQWIAERRLHAQSLAQVEGTIGWKPLSLFPEFSGALAGQPIIPAPLPTSAGSSPASGTNPMALTSLILGCVSLVCCQPLAIVGVILAGVALSQLKHGPQQEGKGLAIAGLVVSICSLVFFAVLLAIGFFTRMFEQFHK
jgi:hypothetical protein